MSFDLFSWAKNLDLSEIDADGVSRATMKLVLLVMAGTANPEYFASVSTLARETALNRKAVFRALGALEKAGLIQDTGERLGKTRQIVVWKLSTEDTQLGTVPNREQYPNIHKSVPNCPGNSTQLGIRNLRFNQDINSSRAPAPARAYMALAKTAITGK